MCTFPYNSSSSEAPSTMDFLHTHPETTNLVVRKKHILLVEDNPLLQHFHSMWLDDLHYDVTVVDSGEDALAKNIANYDAVLMDIDLPGDDGIKITQKLLQKNPQLKIPVIACTSYPEADMKDACVAVGMVDYLQKPISTARLAQSLKIHLI